MGLNSSYQSIGMIFGPLLGGAIATISIPSTFFVGGIFVVVCYLLALRVLKPSNKPQSAF